MRVLGREPGTIMGPDAHKSHPLFGGGIAKTGGGSGCILIVKIA